MKHKVSELEGALLDAAVALAEGRKPFHPWNRKSEPLILAVLTDSFENIPGYSANWQHGGPIIERERIELQWLGDRWGANYWPSEPEDGNEIWPGQTPLTAAMRAYVASKLGEEVELPC